MDNTNPSGWPARFALVLIMGLTAAHAWWLACPTEDAFISFRFARNLATGHGLVWNVGEAPVEGFTNFLWTILCAGLYRCHLDVSRGAALLGGGAALVTVLLTYRFGQDMLALRRGYALLACAMVAAAGPVAAWAATGMETTFFGMCLLAGCWLLARGHARQSRGDVAWGSFWLLLATLTRPEGFGAFVVAAAMMLAARPRAWSWQTAAQPLLMYLLPFTAYFVWRYNYFGALLPNTFYAKTGGTVFQYLRGAIYCGYFAFHFVLPVLWIPLLLAWQRGDRSSQSASSWGRMVQNHFGAWLLAAVTAAYTLYIIYVGGDYMPFYRFFVPIMPMIYLLISRASQALAQDVGQCKPRLRLFRSLLVVSIAGLLVHSTPVAGLLFTTPRVTHGNYQGVRQGHWWTARYVVIGHFFNSYRHNGSESLYTSAIGIIPYLCPMKVYDEHGIVDPVVARQPSSRKRPGWGLAGHEKDGLMRGLSRKPTFVMFSRQLTKEPLAFPTFSPAADAILRADYHVTSVWLNDARNREEGYFSFLERNDRPKATTKPSV